MNDPQQILIELKPELRQFRGVIFELDMPTIDQEATLSAVFGAIQTRRFDATRHDLSDNAELVWVANDLAINAVGLTENVEFEDDARARAYDSVVKLGEAIRDQLLQYGAYRDGRFNYEFQGFLKNDANTVVLRKVCPATAAADAELDDPAY